MKPLHTNQLIHSSSPYLLQHAHNPVNWVAWSDDVIQMAQAEKKLLLISIGYAACHWCHVMEHECFEDEDVAAVMNENFICVKVDREERPDVDHYYMSAVQMMQQQGGWPLNVIALPDGKPVWGGTYFPKDAWIRNLLAVKNYYDDNCDEVEKYAAALQQGLKQGNLIAQTAGDNLLTKNSVEDTVANWKMRFDTVNGGKMGSPKFPMPVNIEFLMYYGFKNSDNEILEFVELTLQKMLQGGIYDQIGGGFARYSIDEKWKVPHFEKMLYDNGQLLSVYSKAYQLFQLPAFKSVVFETISFLERDMMDETGAFYSSIDADSEGEEGKYYVWKPAELKPLLEDDLELFADYFNMNEQGYWENGNYILLLNLDDKDFSRKHDLTIDQLRLKVDKWKALLLEYRNKRISPALDDKILTSWNALVIQGLADAYRVFGEDRFLQMAVKNARFLLENLLDKNTGMLMHTWKSGKASVNGFLEDYALLIKALITLFEVTGYENWIAKAVQLLASVNQYFEDKQTGLFYFAAHVEKSTVINHFQTEDNVIPASNSVMAENLFRLGLIVGDAKYIEASKKMAGYFTGRFLQYPMSYANWGSLMLKWLWPFYEMVFCGAEAQKLFRVMQNQFHPDVIWAVAEKPGKLPLFESRFVKGENLIYVCENSSCQLPVQTVKEAEKLLR
ncbi:MAG: thioredoxin domain-containing protein [Draconibacterium sp.]|nr:MAG: thioredoxin domain-containing protein [Draconibacterium sp.]